MLFKMQMNSVLLLLTIVFAGLFSLSQCVQNGISMDNSSANTAAGVSTVAASAEEEQPRSSVNGITSRTGKAISFFPSSPVHQGNKDASEDNGRVTAARRIRFGDNDDTNYVNSNDITGSSIEIGERRPVSAYKRPDDGSIYNTNPNYYSRPYEYSYNDQGQYFNPQSEPNYDQQQGNYYRPPQQSAPSSRPPPVSQTYHHIPYPQSQRYPQSQNYPQRQQYSQQPPQYYSQYPQQSQNSGPSNYPSNGPYYAPQQRPQGYYGPNTQQSPQQYDNYSPNYPNGGPVGGGSSGENGGFIGGLGEILNGLTGGGAGGFGGGGFGGAGGGPANALGAVGGQFGYAIENIVRYDDYQCVPKIVCQMVGNPQRQSTLPSWFNAPSLTALISAVPSTNPMLVFGRAALLGLSGGERNCDSVYPRCPRNEDDVLNYLNNHRGGFFRFFNGGSAYGDVSDDDDGGYGQQQQQQQPQYPEYAQYQPQQQSQQNLYQQQQGSIGGIQGGGGPGSGLDLGTLQSLAEAINQGGGINLSNLGSNLGLLGNLASLGSALGAVTGGAGNNSPQKQTPPSSSLGSNLSLLSNLGSQLGLGNTVSNLLTGIVGARFAGRKARKLHKRNAEGSSMDDSLDKLLLSLGEEAVSTGDQDSEGVTSKKRNLNKEIGDDATRVENVEKVGLQKRKKYHQDYEKKEKIRQVEKLLGVEARIINKEEIESEAEGRVVNGNFAVHNSLLLNPIVFPDDYSPGSIDSTESSQGPLRLAFPSSSFNQDTRIESNAPQQLSTFAFPSSYQNLDDNRGGKAYQFSQSTVHYPAPNTPFNQLQFPETFQNEEGIILDIPKPLPLEYYDRTKMIFPDRTGTGNLRFDSDFLLQDQRDYFGQNKIRIGRILSGANQNRPVSYQGSYNQNPGAVSFNRGDVLIFHNHRDQNSGNYNSYNQQNKRPQFDFGNRYPITNSLNNNRYQVQDNYYGNNNRYQQQQSSSSSSQNSNSNKVYVTNGQGIVTYYLNERGEKIAV